MHKDILVCFEVTIVGYVGDLKTFITPLLDDERVEVVAIGTEVDPWRFAVFCVMDRTMRARIDVTR